MNKIYQEPIDKAQSLIDGVKVQAEALAKRGLVIDVEKLSAACRALSEAGTVQDVETYEEAVRKQAALAEQAAKEQESKAKSIKDKQEQPKDNPNKKSKP